MSCYVINIILVKSYKKHIFCCFFLHFKINFLHLTFTSCIGHYENTIESSAKCSSTQHQNI